MEDLRANNNSETTNIPETGPERAFYRLLGQLEAIRQRAEDPNATDEEHAKARAEMEHWAPIFEKEIDYLDKIDKQERAKMAMAAKKDVEASEIASEERKAEADDGRRFISNNGWVGYDPGIKSADGDDNWVSHVE